MRMTLVRTQIAFAALMLLLVALLVGVAGYAYARLRIGSTPYARIIAAKDLVADILPPPEYIIEAYLEANMVERFGLDAERTAKLAALKKDFDERHQYWKGVDLPDTLRSSLIEKAARPAETFFAELDGTFLPAVSRGDKAAAEASFAKLTDAYRMQRAAVDATVELANKFLDEAEAAATRESTDIKWIAGAALALVLLCLGLTTSYVKRRFANAVEDMADRMSALARGESTGTLPYVDRADEVGAMARAMVVFDGVMREKLERESRDAAQNREQARLERVAREADREAGAREAQLVIASLAQGLGRLSDGDLVHQIDTPFGGEADRLRNDFNASITKLRDMMQHVVADSEAIRAGSRDINLAANDLADRTNKHAATLEETTAALVEMTRAVRGTADGAAHARELVAQTKGHADRGGEIAKRAIAAMSGIEQASNQISDISGVIDEIAFQTNLLALNAGVEAARAGDSGRGFAVVAQEVRALAQRSADAAKEIADLISGSREQVETGVGLVGQTGAALGRIAEEVDKLSQTVATISSNARDQSVGLDEISTALNRMDQVTQQNAEMVKQSTEASENLARQADDLTALVGRFSIGREPKLVAGSRRDLSPPSRSAARERAPAPAARAVSAAGARGPARAVSNGSDWNEF